MHNTTSSLHHSTKPPFEVDFFGLWHAFRQRLWIIGLCLLVTCGVGLLYVAQTPTTYEAVTVIQIEGMERKVVNIQDVANEDLKSTEHLKTIEQNLSNQVVLQAVIEALKVTPGQLNLKPRPDQPYTMAHMMRALTEQTTVKLQRGTRLINVIVENSDPALAQALSTGMVKQFIRAYLEQRLNISADASTVLIEARDRLLQRVAESEAAVQTYKEEHPGLPLDDSMALIDNRLLALSENLNEARTRRFKLEADEKQLTLLSPSPPLELLRVNSVAAAPVVLTMQRDVAAAESEFAALSERYLPRHPKFIQAQRKVGELRQNFHRTIQETAAGVSTSLRVARDAEEAAAALLREQEQAKLDFSKTSLPYAALLKELESDRELFQGIQRRLKETQVTKTLDQQNVRVVQPAFLPDKPNKPKKGLVLVAAVMSGLLIGALLVLALNLADDSLKTVDQVEQELDYPVVGSVPTVDLKTLQAGFEATVKEPDAPLAEAFRSLRASLSLLQGGKEQRVILFTSAIPGEGKTFCSVNYAVALAQLGQRTLLIDGDLRLPTVHKLFFDTPPARGISALLLEQASLGQVVCSTKVENLDVLPSGARAPHPAELIAKGAFARVLTEALARYDRVVIDSAPIHAVADSLLLAKHVESVCLVLRAGTTSRRLVARALQKISEADGEVSGIVLNQLPKSGMNYYYYYSAGKYGDGVYGSPVQSQG